MSYVLCRKNARKNDRDFIVAVARCIYVNEWTDRMERQNRDHGWAGAELTEITPATQRWAFEVARAFVMRLEDQFKQNLDEILLDWEERWDGDREFNEENAGWYCAMQAMGHGVGLRDAGGLDIDRLPYL